MLKNDILENILIDKLIFWGKWLGVAPDGRKVIITWGCIPWSRVSVRILKARKSHYEGQQLNVISKSPIEIELPEGFQLYGGAKWLTIGYEDQLKIKEEQVKEAFFHLSEYIQDVRWHPIVPSPELYGYRNKVEFSWGKYISAKEGIHDGFRFGFHAQGQFDRIIDCSYCALADAEINAIFLDVDTFSRASGLPTYDPKTQVWFYRHFVVRKAKKTGEIMLIFSVNGIWKDTQTEDTMEYFFTDMVQELSEKYKNIVSIYFLENTGKADIVTGNPVLLFGKKSIQEELLGLTFEIQPKSFFQVNTLWAEKLYTSVINAIEHKWGILLDLYAGTGTIGILLAPYFQKVYSVELVADASRDGEKNSVRNGITNVEFVNAKVEDFTAQIGSRFTIDTSQLTIIVDPPRDGMHPSTLPCILSLGAREIIYVSCNPATLARDLAVLLGKWDASTVKSEEDEGVSQVVPSPPPIASTSSTAQYRITDIIPVDMFPHTHHIETVVRLERRD